MPSCNGPGGSDVFVSSRARLALVTTDPLLRVVGYNAVARAMLPPGDGHVVGKPLHEVIPWSPARVRAAARAVLERGRNATVPTDPAAPADSIEVQPLLEDGAVAGVIVSWVARAGRRGTGEDLLGVLADMTTTLAGVRSLAEAVRVITEHCMEHMGASSGALALKTEAETLRVEAICGAHSRYTEGEELPLSRATLLGEAVSMGDTLLGEAGARTYAAAIRIGGRIIGAVELEFSEPGDHERLVRAATALWALALGRARTYETERAARSSLREATNRVAFLAESTRTLNESLELGETLTRLARLSVPRLGDVCGIHLLRGATPRLTASADADVGAAGTSLAWLKSRGGISSAEALQRVLETGEATIVRLHRGDSERSLATGRKMLEALRSLDLASVAIVPLTVHGRVLGTMTIATRAARGVGADPDMVLAEEIGIRAGTAIERAQLYQEQAHAINQLQANLLPPALPKIPGLELASFFVPATRSGGVGGDFYDVLQLRDGRVLLVIGDVQGKGIPAAATTGLVRQAVRAIALTATHPSEIVAHVNEVLLAGPTGTDDELHRLCTMCALVVRPGVDGAGVTLTSAGHPLPLLVSPGRDVIRVGHSGMLTGAFGDATWIDSEIYLARGDTLLCVTDGVTERREGNRFFEDELEGVARAAAGAGAEALVESVRTQALSFSPSAPADDMAVLAMRALGTQSRG